MWNGLDRWHDRDMDIAPTTGRGDSGIEFARSSTDRMLFGVCGGFAKRYGVDTYVVRIALLLLTLTGGLGVVLYVVGWSVSRPAEDPEPNGAVAPVAISSDLWQSSSRPAAS
jgi:phage shock protein PspC (stress-responsive transcriptional regulator)